MPSNPLILYKNFAANTNVSHIGLGVAALNNVKTLRAAGIAADVQAITTPGMLHQTLQQSSRSHVIISAPWIPTADLARLTQAHPDTHFYVNCHSNVGFLQADANGVELFRQAMDLQTGSHNFHVAGNSARFTEWVRQAYGIPCTYLPNCYYLDPEHAPLPHPYGHSNDTLRIGAFGATRPLKNLMSAAGAALEMATSLRRPLEFWVSSGRAEGGGLHVLSALSGLLAGLPGVTTHLAGWRSWPEFRRLVGQMHLLLQPSYTESFNMVTADGVAMGVPSVVSHAIDWAPDYWKSHVDDVCDIARVGKLVLHHPHATRDGWNALVKHNTDALAAWKHALAA